jgi:hypothetical protein
MCEPSLIEEVTTVVKVRVTPGICRNKSEINRSRLCVSSVTTFRR